MINILASKPGNVVTTFRRISASATSWRPPLRYQRITHSMPQEKVEVFKSLETWVFTNVLPLLKPVEKCWQPSEFLPNPTQSISDFVDEVQALQHRTLGIPDEYFVVLVGNMLTEDAVPTYETILNTCDGIHDETASSPSPWATWIRAWTAEENRHGDLLRAYLYLSGRIDMMMIDRTLQYLIGAGMDAGFENNPYIGFVYTSIQERATFVMHGNFAKLSKECGDFTLARICGTIAADEKRHENAYIKIVEKLLEVDPNDTMLAIGNLLRKGVTIPSSLMYDGHDPHLFTHFVLAIQRLRLYTTNDYVDILEFLIGRWGLEKLEGLKGDGRREQEFVCNLPYRTKLLQERIEERTNKHINPHKLKFSWIFNKEITI